MAIIKVIKKNNKTHTSLKKVLEYVGEKAYETYRINYSENYKKGAYEFFETKNYFHKTGGREYHHYIQSFSSDKISKEKVLEIVINGLKNLSQSMKSL
ncbi:relaxase/mobilization nuclease domain-containing protein [Fusobacterium varium]